MKGKLRETFSFYRQDPRRRAKDLLYLNLAVNCAYAVLEAVGGVTMRSPWLGTLAFFYIVLSGIRFYLLRGYRQGTAPETSEGWRKYRGAAAWMLLLTVALLGMFCVTMYGGHTIAYPGYMIYAIALYTFYAAISAVRSVVVCRRYRDPILSAGKALNLAAASLSVYTLQSAMISAFGEEGAFKTQMGNWVAAAVFLFLIGMAAFMIGKSTKRLRLLFQKEGETTEP